MRLRIRLFNTPILLATTLLVTPFNLLAQDTAPAAAITSETSDQDESGFVINFNNVDIKEYLRFISRISGRNFIYDEQQLSFRVTIISEEPASLEDILTSLVHTLRINGLSLLEEGNNFLIHANPGIKAMSPLSVSTDETGKLAYQGSEFVTRLFRLRNITTSTARPIVQTLISPQATLEGSEESNHLILTDNIANVERISDLLEELDSPQTRLEIGQYRAYRMSIRDLVLLADRIITPLAGEESFILVPRTETNSVFIVSTEQLLNRTIELMTLIDSGWTQTGVVSNTTASFIGDNLDENFPLDTTAINPETDLPFGQIPEEETTTKQTPTNLIPTNLPDDAFLPNIISPIGFEPQTAEEGFIEAQVESNDYAVVGLHYRRGDQLQSVLSNLVAGFVGNSKADSDLAYTLSSAQWVEGTNSIVFSGPSSTIARAKSIISELDKPVRQVLIEMLILETSIDNSLRFGLELGVRHQSPDFSGTFSSMVPNSRTSPLPIALNNTTLSGALTGNSLANVAGLNLGAIGRVITHNGQGFTAIGGLLTALNEDSETEVLLNPKLITENNIPAEIFVGQSIPFRGQSITNDLGNVITTNVEYRDVGTRLRVTPFLGPCSDIVTLEIEQEISREDPNQGAVVAALGQPTLQTSTTTTRVHVPNNYFVAISGVLQDETIRQTSRVPCLGGIPFLGSAFKDEANQVRKINLMVFIRPTIIDTADDFEEMTRRQQGQYDDNKSRPDPMTLEISEGLKWLNLCVPK